jgi:hypothetical protein
MNDTGNLMRTGKLPLLSATLLSIALLAAANPTSSDWQIGPFTRPTNAPVITPNKTSLFTDPIAKAPIHWESLHTFNPAAIVRDNKIYVLYRAEDDTGKMQIGEHTSRHQHRRHHPSPASPTPSSTPPPTPSNPASGPAA